MIESPGILIDTTRCTGCERCVAACKRENRLPADRPRAGQVRIDDLSATRFSTIRQLEGDHYVRQQCRHCLEPGCVSACLVGAMQQTAEGPVIYDADRCMGCRYCLLACPFDVPRYDWEAAVPTVRKCTFCYHRLQQGLVPACVEACPAEALRFGPRPELLAEARRRLRADPARYRARIYGEHEVGGTSVLLISDYALDTLGWPNTPEQPLPQLTRAALDKVPATVLAVSALMGGLHWIIGRRMRLAAEARAGATGGRRRIPTRSHGWTSMPRRLQLLKTVLWALVGALVPITIVRFVRGLGAVTNLSDGAPWGLWVGFDVMAGVALAAGGFVMAAAVHVLHLERYRGFVRPAILTAWLGYIAVAVGLLYDLGLPWHIWHPIIYPQLHSVLFEVAACVMLYLTVLTLEFAPTALEHPRLQRPLLRRVYRGLRLAILPLVITGIVLSTLHQSSLGSLFLITPHRLHALWYSPILPVLFFVSAVALGLMTVVLESLLAAAFLGHRPHADLLAGLGKVAAAVLLLYLGLRVGDLALRGQLGLVADGSWQSGLFLLELAVSVLLPVLLLLSPAGRNSAGVGIAAGLVVAGMVGYRLDVAVVAFARPAGVSYFPSWMEFAISLGIVAAAALVFIYLAEHLSVYDDVHEQPAPVAPPIGAATVRWLLPAPLAGVRRHSWAAMVAAVITVPLLPLAGARRPATPVSPARSVEAMKRPGAGRGVLVLAAAAAPAPVDSPRLVLAIDGNRDGRLVLFDHDAHEERAGGETSCRVCHHLDLPLDRNTACSACHRDMYEPRSSFNHRAHTRALPGEAGCRECHQAGETRTLQHATPCSACHTGTPAAPGSPPTAVASPIPSAHERWREASGYLDAMHGLCVHCHEQALKEDPGAHPPALAECSTCHDADLKRELQRLVPQRRDARLSSPGVMGWTSPFAGPRSPPAGGGQP